jgi:TMEM175 potassium channel family protein
VARAKVSAERLRIFSDAVFAVLITVLVLELRPPEHPTFQSLLLLWPTWLSYAMSYLFIAVVWINHHHLMRYANDATTRLIWINFAFLFSVSLVPLSTAWMAVSKLAPQPVAFYAALFFVVNAAYLLLVRELIGRTRHKDITPRTRKIMRLRAIATLGLFAVATIVALITPLAALGLCCICLVVYLKPDADGI